jgi:hypothetical protein
MPGSDTESSTVQRDQYFDVSTKTEAQMTDSSKKTSLETSLEKKSIEHGSSTRAANSDIEKGDANVPSQPSHPPGLDPADFPDGGLEAVSWFFEVICLLGFVFVGAEILLFRQLVWRVFISRRQPRPDKAVSY